ncbi:hypothetical protein AB0I49_04565 [Streptomyces sp. NPDC050617]|uniref:hypothetical protein n=1 Tax=Streptomyces sp. NPDC050617 TaxID=3154628 RepID=UPI003436DCFC
MVRPPAPDSSPPVRPPYAPETEAVAGASQDAVAAPAPTGHVMRVLPLGTGLALTGLGLAFAGLRLRRR